MAKVFVTAQAQGKFIIDPQNRQPVGREQREVNKVFEGDQPIDDIVAWANGHQAPGVTLRFETAEAPPAEPPKAPEEQP